MHSTTEQLIVRFGEWFEEAHAHPAIIDHTVMNVATVNADGAPSSRMVLLKSFDARGFAFFTNFESRKSGDIAGNPQVALCFYWSALGKQVRVEGVAARVSEEEADDYFNKRPRESQIGAWASRQSEPLVSREALMQRFVEVEARFKGKPVTRPPHWSGWRVSPSLIEFWEHSDHRLHKRECFTRQQGDEWAGVLLCP